MPDVVDAVIFDFGGVFTKSPLAAFDAAAKELGTTGKLLQSVLLGPYHEDTDHPMHRLERGEIDVRQANEEIGRLAEEAGASFDLRALGKVFSLGAARQEMIERAQALRQAGYKLGLLTNNVREFGATWKKMLPIDELFHSVVDSSDVGMRKPNPAIYKRALADLEVPAERALFIDDFQSNVAAAAAVGLQTLHMAPDAEDAVFATLDRLIAARA